MVGGTFARIVRKVALGVLRDARDRGDVDDGASIAMLVLCCFCDEWEESRSHKVDLRDVGAVSGFPVFESGVLRVEKVLAKFLRGLAFGRLSGSADAGVVDQDVEVFLLGRQLLD